MDSDTPKWRTFKRCPIGYFQIDIAEARTALGERCLIVPMDLIREFAVARLSENANRKTAWELLECAHQTLPYKIATRRARLWCNCKREPSTLRKNCDVSLAYFVKEASKTDLHFVVVPANLTLQLRRSNTPNCPHKKQKQPTRRTPTPLLCDLRAWPCYAI